MELSELFKMYWHKAVQTEQRLKIPAVYLLAHAYVETEEGEKIATDLEHGFDVIIPKNISAFKQFWIDVWTKIKSWFKKENEIVSTSVKKEVSVIKPDEDAILHFFDNVKYHAKFEYLQDVDRFTRYVWMGKKYEYIYVKKFKDAVNQIQSFL